MVTSWAVVAVRAPADEGTFLRSGLELDITPKCLAGASPWQHFFSRAPGGKFKIGAFLNCLNIFHCMFSSYVVLL